MRQIITFEVVKLTGYKKFYCTCGKKVARQRTFDQTINPWNKNDQGTIKSRHEILVELRAEIVKWQSKIDECTHDSTTKS